MTDLCHHRGCTRVAYFLITLKGRARIGACVRHLGFVLRHQGWHLIDGGDAIRITEPRRTR